MFGTCQGEDVSFPVPPPPSPPSRSPSAFESGNESKRDFSGPLIQIISDQGDIPECQGQPVTVISCSKAKINFDKLNGEPITLPDGTELSFKYGNDELNPGGFYDSAFYERFQENYGSCTFTFSEEESYIIGNCQTDKGSYSIETCGNGCFLYLTQDFSSIGFIDR